ncbi:RxLR effector protein [Phytophthora megakarya]|uniref:RxLR effector protein n=1 Tax=Phytophthora megakarya TaxID=4795 RepID=A0A225WJ37_9STRA|nr:RxLR effector protein [Phytophthora megakarya]
MRSFSLIFAAVAVAVLATCTANADSDQSKILTIKSSDFTHQLDIGHKNEDTTRLLRVYQPNEELDKEERMLDGRSVRNAAKSILNINDLSAKNEKALAVYKAWASKFKYKHTVSDHLKIGEKEKYTPIWNGYVAYLSNTFTSL